MRDGGLVWCGARQETNEQDLIKWLSAADKVAKLESSRPNGLAVLPDHTPVRIEIDRPFLSAAIPNKIELRTGEIVGLAGLEGSGQGRMLRAIFRHRRGFSKGVRRIGSVSYVTGDRQKEGIFSLWSTLLT